MKKVLLSLVLMLAAVAASGAPGARAAEVPAAIAGKGYVLTQNWDFGEVIKTRKELDALFYTRYVYNNGKQDYLPGNKEWERYRDDGNHVFTDHTLQLVARMPGGLFNGGITSGMIRSKWTGKYGYYECRIKVPKGLSLWPACWINPEDKTWPPEIDIVEVVDNGRDTTRRSFHGLKNGKGDKSVVTFTKLNKHNAYEPGIDYADGFHTFAVEWTPTLVRHYVDDVLVDERTMPWRHDDGSDGGPAHVLVNLAVGGEWPGAPQSEALFPAALDVDYVRVWQKP